MVSDSQEMAQILQQDAAVCQDQLEIKMEVQMQGQIQDLVKGGPKYFG